jgi:hypothetical protein
MSNIPPTAWLFFKAAPHYARRLAKTARILVIGTGAAEVNRRASVSAAV